MPDFTLLNPSFPREIQGFMKIFEKTEKKLVSLYAACQAPSLTLTGEATDIL
jgi:hypothetical protein